MTPARRRRLATALLLAVAALLVFLRPGVAQSPWAMWRLFHADVREENFRHMDRVFPAVPVAAGTQPRPLPQAPQPAPLVEVFRHDGRVITREDFLARTRTTGLLVLKDGAVVHEEYRLGADAGARFTSWSVGKSFVATLVAVALAEGKIRSLDDTVATYVPEYAGTAWADVQLDDLLRMASGVRFEEVYFAQFSDIQRVFHKTFLLGRGINDVVTDYPREEAPGTAFHYVSINTQVLTHVLERATGQPLPAYLQAKLWQPLGMEDDAYWNTDRDGNALGFCCLNATLRSYARLGELYRRQGNWDGVQLLPPGWVGQATQRTEPWLQAGTGARHYGERGYGYHWWVPAGADREYFANGIWGQVVWVDERRGVVIVRTAVDRDFAANMGETISFLRAVAAGLGEPR